MRRNEFYFLLFIVALVWATQLYPLTEGVNQGPWIAGDQFYYLAQIHHLEGRLIGDIPFVQSTNPAIMVLPFSVIAFFGEFFGNENVLFFWTFFSIGIIAILVHLLSSQLKWSPYLSLPVFFFGTSGIHFLIKAFALIIPQLDNFRWTGVATWHGLTFLTNLYHPLGNIETIAFLLALIWFLCEKEKRWVNPFLSLIIFFSRTYMAFVFIPFFFLLDLIKYRSVHPFWFVSGGIMALYYTFFSQIPEWKTYTSIYFGALLHTPLQWALIASGLLLLFTVWAILKKNPLQLPLLGGLIIFCLGMLFLPLNDRLNFFKTNLVAVGAIAGLHLVRDKRIVALALVLMFVQVSVIMQNMADNRQYLFSYTKDDLAAIDFLKQYPHSVVFAPEGFSLRVLSQTDHKVFTTQFWWGEPKQKELDVRQYYLGQRKDEILAIWKPDLLYESSSFSPPDYVQVFSSGSVRLLKRV